jgi:hypothetical protein
MTADAYAHRDAIRFGNGSELPLQNLVVGQRVRVLKVSEESMRTTPDDSDTWSELAAR